jgi:hypothetical protein
MTETLLKALAAALGGAVLSWGAASLTLAGRVDALEDGQQRIESMLTTWMLREEERAAMARQRAEETQRQAERLAAKQKPRP